MTRPCLPAYLDRIIAAYRAGYAGRDLHLGYWDDPPDLDTPSAPGEFEAAQARLTERILELAGLRRGQRLLDAACGLGGTLASIAARFEAMTLIGLNIDPRQLELCRDIVPGTSGSLALVAADACALPFAAASLDHVFCIEAMFHFRSRRDFFAEAARLLRPAGTLVVSDILLDDPGGAAPWDRQTIEAAIRRDYGPWPQLWIKTCSLERWAAAEGLAPVMAEDWTVATLPSYRTIAPNENTASWRCPDAGNVLRWLHRHRWLTYQLLILQRR
jgi:SAM-dependent methyltransferase